MAPQTTFVIPHREADESYIVGEPVLAAAVEGWNGRVIEGALADFQPQSGTLRLLPTGQARPVSLRFAQVKRLRIPPKPEAPPLFLPSGFADDALRPFAVQLRDGSVYAGLCHDCRRQPYGVWIFPRVVGADDPERVFLPKQAVAALEFQRGDGERMSESGFGQTLLEMAEAEPLPEVAGDAPTMVETPQQLQQALERQARLKPVPIGEALIGLGKLTAEQLRQALERQKREPNQPLGQMLVKMGLIQPSDLQVALARKMGYPFVDVRKYPVDAAALRLVPAPLAARLRVLPVALLGHALVVAMPDPLQFKAIDELEFTAQRKVIPVVGVAADIQARIAEAYRSLGLTEDSTTGPQAAAAATPLERNVEAWQLVAELVGDTAAEGADERPIEQSDNTLVKLVNSMIIEAFHQRASDIHIEPYPGREKVVIRFRVDGQLRPYLELPSSYRNALVARIKIMCDLDISERRKPQDGKIHFRRFGGLPIELRVATIPTASGLEDVVMRILNASEALPLESLHLSPRNLSELERVLTRPYGMLLCAGPTGSGKTTTLHAALRRLNTPNRKVWTAEDPVEITQRGLRQIQVNPKIGWTFATALRALLRADPDVIMVGEIRDAETAEMAVEASLTGHFVMSTLHTNSAAETILRLRDLGVDPFSFADSLQAILAQRLVRRLCPVCAVHEPIPRERLLELMHDYQAQLPPDHPLRDETELEREWRQRFSRDGELRLGHAPGCPECGQTGYRGRLALHELLVTSPAMRHLVQTGAAPAALMAQAIHDGMRTLRQDGIEKALIGLTTLAEVRAASNV